MMKTNPDQHIDAAQATIIVDRCVPPDGLGIAPSTLKAVLWCLRGLGAPGSELGVAAGVVARRTCLSDRAVRKAIASLREHGILEQTASPAPGRVARFMVDYLRLAEWLHDDDRAQARVITNKDPNNSANTGTTCRRTPAPRAAEHRHHVPPSTSTPAPGSATPARRSATPAPGATDSKEGTALPAKTSSSSSAAAAAADESRWSEWDLIARRAGLDSGTAGQAAEFLVQSGQHDTEAGRTALERLAERCKSGNVTNPIGLLRSILTQPGGPELSKAAVKRRRDQERRTVEFDTVLRTLTREGSRELVRRINAHATQHHGAEFAAALIKPANWGDPGIREYAIRHLDALKAMQPAEVGAA